MEGVALIDLDWRYKCGAWYGLFVATVAAIALLMTAVGFTSANAATDDPGQKWTLEKLVGHALANNKGLEATEFATKTAAEEIYIAEGQQWPQISALGSAFYTPIRERLLFERHGKRPDNPFQETILNYGLELTLPIYTGGRIRHEINIAETGLDAAQSRAAFTRQELIFNVTSAYYTHLRIQYDIAAREAMVRSVGESRRIAQEQVSLGRAANLDVLRLDAKLSRVESDLAIVRNALANTTVTLRVLLALPPDAPLSVAGELLPAQQSTDLATAQASALSNRQDLAAKRREVAAQEERVGIARSLRYPTVGATAFYGFATGVDRRSDGRAREAVRGQAWIPGTTAHRGEATPCDGVSAHHRTDDQLEPLSPAHQCIVRRQSASRRSGSGRRRLAIHVQHT